MFGAILDTPAVINVKVAQTGTGMCLGKKHERGFPMKRLSLGVPL